MDPGPDLSILDDLETELGDVEHALERLQDGSYGICELCGDPISESRLEALPATRACRDDHAAAG
jgi:RNA polymerase-binding transcription factor DksA